MNLLDLFVKIGVQDEASDKISNTSSKIKSGLATAAKVGVRAVSAAATAVGALVGQSVSAYGEYEQLVGGVETLFGAGGATLEEYAADVGKTVAEVSEEYDSLMAAQDTVMANAANAYQTAGLSANEYMDTVTSFSASLIASLEGDTEAAANVADRAITDMADNANKMGTDISSIQNAYQGFAKQNYTMLDNLKLGYGGTQEEMERLISEASEMTDVMEELGVAVDADDMSFGNIVNAISVVQAEMGITGTTSKEAAGTLQGSTAAMKASWANLVAGMADDNADFDTLINNFVTSVSAMGENILPRISIAIEGVSNLISNLLPIIIEEIPTIIEENLPTLLSAGVDVIMALIDGIVEAAPTIITTLLDALGELGSKLAPIFPDLIDVGMDLIDQILEGLVDSLPEILQALIDLTVQVAEALTDPTTLASIIESVFIVLEEIVAALISNLPMIIEAIGQIVSNIGVALLLALENLGVIEWWTNAWNSFKEWITNLWNSITDFFVGIWESIKETFSSAKESLGNFFQEAWDKIVEIWDVVIDFFINIWENIKETFSVVSSVLSTFFSNAWEKIKNIWNVVIDFFKSVWSGIKSVFSVVASTFKEWFSNAWNNIKSIWNAVISFFSNIWAGIKSVFSSVGTTFSGWFKSAWNAVKNAFTNWKTYFSGLWDNVKSVFSNAWSSMSNIGKNIVDGVWNGITNAWENFKSKVTEKFTNLVSSVKSALGIASPSKVFSQIGSYMAEGLGEGWEDEFADVQKTLNSDLDFSANVSGDSGAISSGYGNNITINVNGASYNNEQSLAKAISYQLELMLESRRTSYV